MGNMAKIPKKGSPVKAPKPQNRSPKKDNRAIAFFCLEVILALALFLVPRTPVWIGGGLLGMVTAGFIFVWHVFPKKSTRVIGFVVVILAAGLLGWGVWPPHPGNVANCNEYKNTKMSGGVALTATIGGGADPCETFDGVELKDTTFGSLRVRGGMRALFEALRESAKAKQKAHSKTPDKTPEQKK